MARASDSRSRSRAAAGPAVLPPSMRDRVPFLLYRAAEESHALANQMLADMALTARQAGILTMVTELEPMTQKALGEALRIDRTTMVALVDVLEDKGLVQRHAHAEDRRRNVVELTEKGRDRLHEAGKAAQEAERRFLAPLSRKDAQRLKAALLAVIRPER